MGWVAFRSGQYASARGVFQYLFQEAPYGTHAPGAIYWGARAAEQLGMGEVYQAELKAVVERFSGRLLCSAGWSTVVRPP